MRLMPLLRRLPLAAILLACGLAGTVRAATVHVATNGSHDVANNFDTWAGAATNINAAVVVADTLGRSVLVSNGVFAVTNQLAVSNFTVRSVNGPDAVTVYRPSAAGTLFPIFNVGHSNALVAGFSITNGYWSVANDRGGSVHLTAGTVSNCWIVNTPYIGPTQSGAVYINGGRMTSCLVSNSQPRSFALRLVGGLIEDSTISANYDPYDNGPIIVEGGTMRRCRALSNRAGGNGAGAIYQTGGRIENTLVYGNQTTASGRPGGVRQLGGALVHCTIAGNTNAVAATVGAGVARTAGVMTNCIVSGNSGAGGLNFSGPTSAVWYCSAPELTPGPRGNITNDPQFVSLATGDARLERGSPCMDTGTNLVDVTSDLDQAPRPQDGDAAGGAIADMGAYEVRDPDTGPLDVSFTATPVYGFTPQDVVFTAETLGSNRVVTWYGWDFDNDGIWDVDGAGLAVVTNTYTGGTYSIALRITNSVGETAASTRLDYVTVVDPFIYVSKTGSHTPPFSSWATAATSINDAVALATDVGVQVWVSNGAYSVTSQLTVANAVSVRSVNGPDATTVYRNPAYGTRMFVVSDPGALVAGFTITNAYVNIYGAAVALELYAGTVSNCVVTDCDSLSLGGFQAGIVGVFGGLMTHSVISNNQSRSWVTGVKGDGVLQDSVVYGNYTPYDPAPLWVGGNGVVRRCRLLANWCAAGGGPYTIALGNYLGSGDGGALENCLLSGNRSSWGPIVGMDNQSRLVNCTVASNEAWCSRFAVERLSGTVGITNCIVYGNSGLGQINDPGTPRYSCAPELTAGTGGNRAEDPRFVDLAAGDFRLQFGSPAVDLGTNLPAITVDLDGTNRDARCDMGAFERIHLATGTVAAAFHGQPLEGIGAVTSVFSAVFEGADTNITWWGWDFDDDGTPELSGASLPTVTNIFPAGRYSVSLRVTNSSLETAAWTNADYVSVQSTGNDVYVSTNGSATFPFDTWEKSTSDLEDAFRNAMHPGSTLWVSNGAYAVTARLPLAATNAVRGVGGPQGIVLYRSSTKWFPIFDLAHAAAAVSGVVISNGAGWGSGGALTMTAGTVSNCVMTRTVTGVYPDTVFSMSGGLVTHCLVTNNSPRSHSVQLSGGILQDTTITRSVAGHDQGPLTIAGGLARRCLIVSNTPPGNIPGGVQLQGGRIENCLIAGNKAASSSYGAVRMTGGTMVNCTVTTNDTVSGASGVTRTGGTMTNCIVYANTPPFANYSGDASAGWYSCAPELAAGVQGNITNHPLFEDADNGDFRPAAGSPCINAGFNAADMADATDLDGRPRIVAAIVDMGAYERPTPPGTVIVLR